MPSRCIVRGKHFRVLDFLRATFPFSKVPAMNVNLGFLGIGSVHRIGVVETDGDCELLGAGDYWCLLFGILGDCVRFHLLSISDICGVVVSTYSLELANINCVY